MTACTGKTGPNQEDQKRLGSEENGNGERLAWERGGRVFQAGGTACKRPYHSKSMTCLRFRNTASVAGLCICVSVVGGTTGVNEAGEGGWCQMAFRSWVWSLFLPVRTKWCLVSVKQCDSITTFEFGKDHSWITVVRMDMGKVPCLKGSI